MSAHFKRVGKVGRLDISEWTLPHEEKINQLTESMLETFQTSLRDVYENVRKDNIKILEETLELALVGSDEAGGEAEEANIYFPSMYGRSDGTEGDVPNDPLTLRVSFPSLQRNGLKEPAFDFRLKDCVDEVVEMARDNNQWLNEAKRVHAALKKVVNDLGEEIKSAEKSLNL